jgi:hypothetical protein
LNAHAGVALANPVDGPAQLWVSIEKREHREEHVGRVDILVEDGGRAGSAVPSDIVGKASLARLDVEQVADAGERCRVRDDIAAFGDRLPTGTETAHDVRREAIEEDEDWSGLGVEVGGLEVVENPSVGRDVDGLVVNNDITGWHLDEVGLGNGNRGATCAAFATLLAAALGLGLGR